MEKANEGKLGGLFRAIDFNSETNLGQTKDRNRRLKMLLEDFAKPSLDLSEVSEDILGDAYIFLIERFASDAGKKAGEFFTPRKVSEVVAKLAHPTPGSRICDPMCGSASLLLRAGEEVGGKDYQLFGQESNGQTRALARLNMLLHGQDSARIDWCDTLNSPTLIESDHLMRFDIVVANPPFSLDKWWDESNKTDAYNRFTPYMPTNSNVINGLAESWYLVDAKKPAFIHQLREGVSLVAEAPNSGDGFSRDTQRYKARIRQNADFISPLFMWQGNDGSASS